MKKLRETIKMATAMKQSFGFTLLEVLFACAISAIVMCLALPSYQAQQVSSYRKTAQAELSGIRLQIEVLRSTTASGGLEEVLNLASLIHNASLLKRYDFTLTPNPLEGEKPYYISALPKGKQLGNGGLTLSEIGAGCWHKDLDRPISPVCSERSW